MNYESEFTPTFLKLLRKLDKQVKERVLNEIENVLKDPRKGSLRLRGRSASSGGGATTV